MNHITTPLYTERSFVISVLMIDYGLDGYKQEFNKEDIAGIKVKGDNDEHREKWECIQEETAGRTGNLLRYKDLEILQHHEGKTQDETLIRGSSHHAIDIRSGAQTVINTGSEDL